MRRNRPAAAGLVLAAVALVLSATPAQARPAPSGYPPGMAEQVGRDLGLTRAQAAERPAREQRAAELAPALRARLAGRFGGSWVDETGALVVATTDAADVRALAAAGARPVLVGRSLADLESIVGTLNRAPAPGQAIRGWHADVRANHVVVLAADAAAGEAFVRASGVDRAAVRVEVTAERPVPYRDVRGGDPFYLTGLRTCVIGFTVRRGEKQGFVTAGHCLKPRPDGTPPSTIGKVEGWSYPGDDYAWASLDPALKAVGLVGRPTGIRIAGSTEAQPGSSACSLGVTVGARCGTIQQYNATINYPDGTVTGLIRASVCSAPGDSGAPLVAGNQAQGVLSGGTGNCSTGGASYYQPINEVLAVYGLTLLTAQ
ncbi:S1 family peptidase [Spongiactinospora rosea]|uniref:S1 family peptidase n=1 Tax=Spongiactinospora rosea TaxID=2248750 RepID=A0A366M356_9ACTN|nr:S1 family peptidase [Spongiactinospora rosea]RBQ20678.1 S1 family peptidase [Spongiactinospora rosea]